MPSSRDRRPPRSAPAISAAAFRPIAYEAGLKERAVVIEYDSLATAQAAHDSPAYQEALKALGDGAVRDLRLVEGLD